MFMEKIKKYIKTPLILIGCLVIYLTIMTILAYSGVMGLKTISKVNFILFAVILLLAGIIKGKKASKRGYLEGLKLGGICALAMLLLNLIFYRSFSLFIVLYYLVILASSTIGSMIGINLKH